MQLQYVGQAIVVAESTDNIVEWEDVQGVLRHFFPDEPQSPIEFTVQVGEVRKTLRYYPFNYTQHFEVTMKHLQITGG